MMMMTMMMMTMMMMIAIIASIRWAAAEFICHEKNIHVNSVNVRGKGQVGCRKGILFIVLAVELKFPRVFYVDVSIRTSHCDIIIILYYCTIYTIYNILYTIYYYTTNIIIISKTMFMVLSSWQSHCESSHTVHPEQFPALFTRCRTFSPFPPPPSADLRYKAICR